MVDPTKITDFNLNQFELEERILFWLLVSGKNAKTTSRLLDKLLNILNKFSSPFQSIKFYDQENPNCLESLLKSIGFGCFKVKAKGIRQLVYDDNLDLKTCSVKDLERVHGIGPKTARCFIMHSRADARYAGLDTHVLKWLASLGYKVPKGTPTGKAYERLEKVFLSLCDSLGKKPAVLDLEIWNTYSS